MTDATQKPAAPDAAVAAGTQPDDSLAFTLDGRPVTAQKGELIIAAAERAGTFIPRFCYHPRMRPVGMCRMCLVEVSGPRGATLQPACFVEVQAGMEVVTTSDKVKKAQDGVLEFLLVNHPLDCPVCDKGGECPLQDQTLAYGPGETRFVEEKRHFEKPIPISELVLLDRERCIQCSRCTRFADEVAGEAQIDFLGRGEQLEVNTFPELPFTSYFSGNTVQICPVGALTATPYRFTARPWDLDQVESTCTTCAFGCRVAVQSSANRVTRLLGIDADPVNQGWLCDKGRFAYEAVNADDRLAEPLVRKDGELVPVSWHEALAAGRPARLSTDGPTRRRVRRRGRSVGVIGGARLHQRGRLRLGQAGQGRAGHRLGRRPAGRRAPRRAGARPAPGHHRQTPPAPTRSSCSTGDLREELPVLFLRLRARRRGRRRRPSGGALAPGHARSPLRRRLAAVRPRRGHRAGRALVDRTAPVPRRPTTARPGRGPPPARPTPTTWWWWPAGRRWPRTARWWPRLLCELARALPERPLPVRAPPGQRARVPSTWAWPRASFPVGWPSRPGATGSPRRGDRCPTAGAWTPPAILAAAGRRTPARRPRPGRAGGRPARATSPTAGWPDGP